MICSICSSTMQQIENGIYTCEMCGYTYFEENRINRISLSASTKLAEKKAVEQISFDKLVCPKDHHSLVNLQEDSIPMEVTLLKCPECQGVIATNQNLFNFKNAQQAKISYFKTWNIPLPSLKAVLVYSFFAIVSITAISSFGFFISQNSQKSQASQIIQHLTIREINGKNVVSFATSQPFSSRLIFYNDNKDLVLYDIPIDTVENRTHFIILDKPPLSPHTFFKIMLSTNNQISESEFYPFILTK